MNEWDLLFEFSLFHIQLSQSDWESNKSGAFYTERKKNTPLILAGQMEIKTLKGN